MEYHLVRTWKDGNLATREEIIDAIQAGMNRAQSTFSQLSQEQLETKVHDEPEGWNARQILAHLANRQPTYDLLITMALEGNGAPPGGFSIDDWNHKLVAERQQHNSDLLLQEFRDVHVNLIAKTEKLRDDHLRLPLVLPNRETNLGDALLGSGGMHSIQHASEVEEVLEISHED
jgi:hypothetical protein